MDIVWIILGLLALTTWIAWLVRVVREDGLGHREPPRSHHEDLTDLPWIRSL